MVIQLLVSLYLLDTLLGFNMSGIINATNLEVSNIKDSTGTNTAMTVDSSGRVSKGVQVFWVLGFSNNNQREGTMVFDTQHKMVNCSYNTSTGQVTVPVAGIYLCTFTTNANDASKFIYVNGSNPYNPINHWHNGSDANTFVIPLQLSANDIVTAHLNTDGNGTYGSNTAFTGTYLG